MLRLLLVATLAYVGYRAGRSFIDDVPDGFEPTPTRSTPSKRRKR